jgi:hypothetical protein
MWMPQMSKAKALDAGENVVGCFGPAGWFGVGIGRLNIVFDRLLVLAGRAKHAAFERPYECGQGNDRRADDGLKARPQSTYRDDKKRLGRPHCQD